jgi:4-hydroxy-3-methylbut-2-enyl diphosphate reductase
MKIEIDDRSGFCFGVDHAVKAAEKALEKPGELFCLGDIVHNLEETRRLREKGLKEASKDNMSSLSGKRVMIRAHGEPPETYSALRESGIEMIDATCPVVLKLQQRIQKTWKEYPERQIVIFGKPGHPEVNGLSGQTLHQAIIVNDHFEGLDNIDFCRPIALFCQTTQSLEGYKELVAEIENRMHPLHSNLSKVLFAHDTICRQVSNRGPALKKFAENHDVLIFVSGAGSSNGRYLYGLCSSANPRSHWVANESQLKKEWFVKADSIGISGATSTPRWQLEKIAQAINSLILSA